jgi:Cys-tRNA(Pro)/Cys-tRNA(Cys) deacylase
MKTNAARILEETGIGFVLREYQVDPDDLSAEAVAANPGPPSEYLAVIPGTPRSSKAPARLTGDGRIEMTPPKEIQRLTGYIRGGVTALACRKPRPNSHAAADTSVAPVRVALRATILSLLLARAAELANVSHRS